MICFLPLTLCAIQPRLVVQLFLLRPAQPPLERCLVHDICVGRPMTATLDNSFVYKPVNHNVLQQLGHGSLGPPASYISPRCCVQ